MINQFSAYEPNRMISQIPSLDTGSEQNWSVLDLFSGCGGMSLGFARRAPFRIVGAVDLEHGKPCEGAGALNCNATYEANINVSPFNFDITTLTPERLRALVKEQSGFDLKRDTLTVLIACPPCTDFSRAKPSNHLTDGVRNNLVVRCAEYVRAFRPEFVVMENARELIQGRHVHHHAVFVEHLRRAGYEVRSAVHMLNGFGLPQIRERAVILASRVGPVRGFQDLWAGYTLTPNANTVRSAFARLYRNCNAADPMQVSPGLTDTVRRRLEATPSNGGSWFDLARDPKTKKLLTRSMLNRWKARDLGSHPDVYGRLWWDRPAPTIKRECAHVGNGRYAHPEATRLLTVREMATLQGFPFDYVFRSRALANRYRHIGDAVPPIVSFQISALVAWMKSDVRPTPNDWVLPNSCLAVDDIVPLGEEAIAA
jgi:DNA (cytosine-5)-methyltransferase 1